eukprot:GHVU01037068.1.p1 GENE.GHVU01037068.1~~GHVU01037068.1.p1  ORF type:complete len:173 (-),score=16.21 GHVU01037068.1:106-624(-)
MKICISFIYCIVVSFVASSSDKLSLTKREERVGWVDRILNDELSQWAVEICKGYRSKPRLPTPKLLKKECWMELRDEYPLFGKLTFEGIESTPWNKEKEDEQVYPLAVLSVYTYWSSDERKDFYQNSRFKQGLLPSVQDRYFTLIVACRRGNHNNHPSPGNTQRLPSTKLTT